MKTRMTKALASGLARFEVASRMRNPVNAERIDDALAALAYGERAVPPEVVRELLVRRWIASAGPGQGYLPSQLGRARLAAYMGRKHGESEAQS